MRYHYFYQNSKNESCDGWIDARDRNDVYLQLKKQGIKPIKVLGRNPYAWKRWTAIGVLSGLVVTLSVVVLRYRIADRYEAVAWEDRSQIYGDPVLLRDLASDGWRNAMGSEANAWFARHARPGIVCDCECKILNVALDADPIRIELSDAPEMAKMKRLVNGMKREFAAYIDAGGSENDYKILCDERLRTEVGIAANISREFKALENRLSSEARETIEEEWSKKNSLLRSMGLPTVLMPE